MSAERQPHIEPENRNIVRVRIWIGQSARKMTTNSTCCSHEFQFGHVSLQTFSGEGALSNGVYASAWPRQARAWGEETRGSLAISALQNPVLNKKIALLDCLMEYKELNEGTEQFDEEEYRCLKELVGEIADLNELCEDCWDDINLYKQRPLIIDFHSFNPAAIERINQAYLTFLRDESFDIWASTPFRSRNTKNCVALAFYLLKEGGINAGNHQLITWYQKVKHTAVVYTPRDFADLLLKAKTRELTTQNKIDRGWRRTAETLANAAGIRDTDNVENATQVNTDEHEDAAAEEGKKCAVQ